MALEEYNLQRLRLSLMDQFGHPRDDSDLIATANRSINDAVAHICNEVDDWPWLVAEKVFDIPAIATITGDFTKGSRLVKNVTSPSSTHLRQYISTAQTGVRNQGYQVVAISGNQYTLNSQWLGTTGTGTSATVMWHMFELPDDFRRVKSVGGGDTNYGTRFEPLQQAKFLEYRDTKQYCSASEYWYSILNDPLGTSGKLYLSVFPFITDQMSLFTSYWKNPQRLDDDTDVPDIPMTSRVVLLDVAYWLHAVQKGVATDKMQAYAQKALISLQKMVEGREYLNPSKGMNRKRNRFGWRGAPAGYEEF